MQMKITNIKPIRAGQFLFVQIETDAGIHGIGEGGSWGHIEAATSAIEKFATYLVGKDPTPIEHHWGVMHRFAFFHGHAINAAISAIDIALWDIKGKALGVPVHQLFGGAVRSRARVYAHVNEKNIDLAIDEIKRKREQGFTAIGHINPFSDDHDGEAYFKTHVKKIDDAVERVRRMRQAAGEDMDICLEVHRRLTPAEAIEFARAVEPFRPMFIEDPIRFENADSMARVADKIGVPIATGERFKSIYEFRDLFVRGAVEFARVDVCLCGGITGARKVAAMAEAFDIMVVPHNPLSPVGLAACLQIAASIPNFAIQEYTTGLEAQGAATTEAHLGSDIVDHVPEPENGFVDIPTRSGIGIELAADAAEIRPVFTRPVAMRQHVDGSPLDQ